MTASRKRRRALHPVIRAYVRTGRDLGEILRGAGAGGEPVIGAMGLLQEFIAGGRSADGAFLAARNVPIRDMDVDLCVLFLASWAYAAFSRAPDTATRHSAPWMLVHRARTLVSADTPAEVRAYTTLVEARLTGAAGNHREEEGLVKQGLRELGPSSPRRGFLALELASLLAHLGRLREVDAELDGIALAGTGGRKNRVAVLRFINSVQTGQLELAQRFLGGIVETDADRFVSRNVAKYRSALRLMQERPAHGDTEQTRAEYGADFPDWGRVLWCLLTGHVHQALRWARLCEKRNSSCLQGIDCASFNLIRAELSEGNSGAAQRLIDMRRKAGNVSYLDDFFLARTALLSGNRDAAASHFAACLKSVDRYSATGRLGFELRMAPEIPRDGLLQLARRSERINRSRVRTRRKTTAAARTAGSLGTARLIGVSAAMQTVRETAARFAALDVPVLITGETGTGKELVARALHESGSRSALPFVAINCGSISESLLESELFGHEKGAFSGAAAAHRGLFEEAAGGTILLDEIGDIAARLQVALLRVLEAAEIRPVGSSHSRKVGCRILASTNADLEHLVRARKFRRDLFFRLQRLDIHLPPLRRRREDIPPLALHFLNEGRPADVHALMSEELMDALCRQQWPGNVRELRNTIERMRLMNSDKLYYDVDDVDSAADGDFSALELPTAARRPIAVRRPAAEVLSPAVRLKKGKSSVRRQEMLRDLFRRYRRLTRSEVVETMEVSPNTATRDLRALCEEGTIVRVAPSASPRSVYFEMRSGGVRRDT